MYDFGGEKDEEEDDIMKNDEIEQQQEEEALLPNDKEWDLSDSEFYNFFFQGFLEDDSSSFSPPPVVDNQGIIDDKVAIPNLPGGVSNGDDVHGAEKSSSQVENNLNTTIDNDPISKKRKRQERNRDAAMRSRERKKLYVRELEMKSRYFEGECKRLGVFLNCVAAENQALRLSLQSSKALDASRTKQESAVLFLESLLLGSLLWFLGAMCPLNLLEPLRSTREVLLGETDNQNRRSLASKKTGSKIFEHQVFQSFMKGKRCKASRTRIKLSSSFG